MKLKVTLITLSTLLFINNVFAEDLNGQACNKLLASGDAIAALDYAQKMLQANSQDKDALLCQGRSFFAKDDLNKALASFKLAEKNAKDSLDSTVSLFLIANTYKALEQHEVALAQYQLAIKQARLANNKALERMAYNAMGDIHHGNKQLSLALDAYLLGHKLAANDNERGESCEKVALTYHGLNQHDLALEFQIKAYLLHDAVGTLDQYAHSSIELGRYYAMVKNYANAEKTLNKIIQFAKEQGGAYYQAKASSVLATVKFANGDKLAAKALIEQAKSIAKASRDSALEEEIAKETKGLL